MIASEELTRQVRTPMRDTRRLPAPIALLFALLMATVGAATAAEVPSPIAPRIAELREALPGGLEAGPLEATQGLLAQAESDDQAATALVEEAAGLRAQTEDASAQLAVPEPRERDDGHAEWLRLLPDSEPVETAERRLHAARSELDNLRGGLTRINAELGELLAAPSALVEEFAEARRRIDAQRERLVAARAAAETTGLQGRAGVLAAEAGLRRAQARMGVVEARQETLPVRQRLLESRRRAQERALAQSQRRFDTLQARVERLREEALDERRETLLAELALLLDQHPALEAEVDATRALVDRLETLEQRLADSRRAGEASARAIATTSDMLRTTRSRLELGGGDEAIGLLLLAERQRLPDLRRLDRELQEVRRELGGARLAELELNERLIELDAADAAVAGWLREAARAGEDVPAEALDDLREGLEALVDTRADILPDLMETNQRLVASLAGRERSLQELQVITAELTALLDQKLLWVPTHATVDLAWLARHPAGWHDLYKPSRFLTTGRLLRRALPEHWTVALGGLVALGLVPLVRRRLAPSLAAWAKPLRHVSTDRFLLTLRALFASLGAALLPAIAVASLAWLLQNVGEAGRYSDSLGRALAGTVPSFALASALYWLTRPGGLGAAHLRWPDARLGALCVLRRWILWAVIPLQFTVNLAFIRNLDPALDTAGRDAILALCLLLGWLSWSLLSPDGLWTTREGGAHHSTRRGARVLVPAAMGVLAVLALAGYVLTAGVLLRNVWLTVYVVLAVGVVQALLSRWLLLGERRLALRRYLERKAAEEAAEAGDGGPTTAEGEALGEVEPDEVTLQSINAQTRRLLRALVIALAVIGLVWVWSAVLPALGRLDDVILWRVSSVDGAGAAVLEGISLRAVLAGLLVLALTFVAARNLPGLVEIALQSSTRVDAPTRYAVTSVSRYLIVIVGMVVGIGLLGLRWSQLQWMAAALTVGLGFGLQEIFANFISGLILLFERPFRVGDVITIGEITGTVTKVRTRATTIRDFDGKEVVVPNKTFITSQLTNWTLTDTQTRVIVKVGVAYGSPVAKVHELLRQAAQECPLVAPEPAPATWFMAFGASSLDFELRYFVPSMADRLASLDRLNGRIAELFAEHGIEIAFPQMDLHVKDLPPRRGDGPPQATDAAPGDAPEPAGPGPSR